MTVCDIVLNTADQPFIWALGLCLLSLVLHVMKPSMAILALPVKTSALLHRDLCFSVFTLACCQHSILYVTRVFFFLINANHNMLDFCLWRTEHTNPGHGSALCKMCCCCFNIFIPEARTPWRPLIHPTSTSNGTQKVWRSALWPWRGCWSPWSPR